MNNADGLNAVWRVQGFTLARTLRGKLKHERNVKTMIIRATIDGDTDTTSTNCDDYPGCKGCPIRASGGCDEDVRQL